MVRDIVRRALLIWLGFAFLASPAVAGPQPDQRPNDHCQHQPGGSEHGDHHQPAPMTCEHADACRDCAAPSCHTISHCGASATGLPVPHCDASLTLRPDAVPSAIASLLVSRATAPPTHPPLFAG